MRAMMVLLAATGLSGPALAQTVDGEPAEAEERDVIVTGRAAKLYRVEETSSGKLPTKPLASSQAVTVITEQLIRDQGARDAQDLYRNISGVSLFSYAGVTARGFRQQENFYDGLRGDPYIGFSVPQLFNIERVEFLKGPAGMLYGQTAPGGLFNYVTKTPKERFAASASLVAGNFDRYGAQAEVTGPVTSMVAVRLGGFYEARDLPRTFADSKTTIVDGGVQLGTRDGPARLLLKALHIDQDLGANRLRGVIVTNDGEFIGSRRWNHNEPSDFLNLRSDSVQLRAEIEPAEGLAFDVAGRFIDAEERQKYHEPIALIGPANAWTAIAREYRDQIRATETLSVAANAVWSASFGDVSNRLLAGADYSWSRLDFRSRAARGRNTAAPGLPCPLSITVPVYRACDPASYTLPGYTRSFTVNDRQGVYLLNEATIGRLILTGGVRYDAFEDRSGANALDDGDLTWRAGAVFRVRPDVSLFAQWANSFEPQGIGAQDPRAGGPFGPTTGSIVEGGVKTGLFNGAVQSSLSAYRIVRENLLQTDPRGDPEGDGITNSVAFGEVVAKGVDLDVAADLTPDWVLTLTYAYNDTRITKDNGRTVIANAVGKRFANAPEHQLGFWTRYQFRKPGIAFAFGGDYVSERRSISDQRVKPYLVFDGSIIVTRGAWEVLLRVDNIFDKTYAASGFTDRNGHFPGEPRSGFVELTRRF